jgi:hypothetical protein
MMILSSCSSGQSTTDVSKELADTLTDSLVFDKGKSVPGDKPAGNPAAPAAVKAAIPTGGMDAASRTLAVASEYPQITAASLPGHLSAGDSFELLLFTYFADWQNVTGAVVAVEKNGVYAGKYIDVTAKVENVDGKFRMKLTGKVASSVDFGTEDFIVKIGMKRADGQVGNYYEWALNATGTKGGLDGGTDGGGEVCTDLPKRFDADSTIKKGCYLAKQSPVIAAAVKLTLEPGVKIVFSQDTELAISADQALVATGTATDPITLTGAQKQRGFWQGVGFDGNLNEFSRLDHVTVEYAGSTKSDKDAAAVKLTADSRGARLKMTHTTLRESQGWGLYLTGSAVMPEFSANTITKNTLGPANVDGEVAGILDATSSYTGNDVDRFRVRAYRLNKAATWGVPTVSYYLASSLDLSADLTLVPGVTLIFAKEMGLSVSNDIAALIADGTADMPILFTGETKERGFWEGITFSGSNNTRNSFSNVTVEWGGSTTSDKSNAGVKMTGDSHGVQLKMNRTTIKESEGWGMFMTGSAIIPEFAGNVITKNTLGPVSLDSANAHELSPESSYTGNDVDMVRVRSYSINKDVTWKAIGVPYNISDGTRVPFALTLEPGVTLVMDPGSGLDVYDDTGVLHAVGTAVKPIVITGTTKTAGSWGSLTFGNTRQNANTMDYCTVEYGGGDAKSGNNGMIKAASDSRGVGISITNSKIQFSAVWGIWLSHYATATLNNNTMTGNALGDVYKEP